MGIPNGVMAIANGYMATPNGYMATPNGYMATPNGCMVIPNRGIAIANGYMATPIRSTRQHNILLRRMKAKCWSKLSKTEDCTISFFTLLYEYMYTVYRIKCINSLC